MLTERQKTEAQDLFAKGYTTSQVFRHFGAQSIGQDSEVDIEQSAIKNMNEKPALKPLANKITDFLGLKGATDTFGSVLARKGIGTDVAPEVVQEFTPAPTGKEVAGAVLQTGATALAPALAPVSLPAQIATGAALGYAYDVGGDLIEGADTADTLTPGVGTAVGVLAPPVLKGFGRFLKGPSTTASADDLARMASGQEAQQANQVANQITLDSSIVPEQISQSGSAIKQTASDLIESTKRVGKRLSEKSQEQALKAERITNAPTPAVKEAIQSNLDEPLIDFATTADKPTKDAARRMVEIAEAPKKIGTNTRPTQVAEETALEQYNLVVADKKKVGARIGELSKALPKAQNMDMVPAQRNMRDVLRQNGILPDNSGTLNFQSQKYTQEEQAVIQKLYEAATKRDVLSAKDIHETDQLFSKMQRNSRVIDKVDNVFVTVPTETGVKDVNIFKVFRDIYGKQLDKLSPEIKVANRQYRQYVNFLEDVEGKLVSNPEFSDLVSASADTDKFAEAGLRRIFGEGKGAAEREAIYNALDKVSRDLGYKGARADELYAFGEELRKLYPETIPKTGFRGQIGSSIMDKLSGIMEVGKVAPQDQQKALKALLESTE